ncbi:GNAT family N-acetyltransferase [Halovenus salina]|uniref:GNAT family N-acetyltransferase n=1 Tax=Halovenus salina TaxID=1510225 RepID=UPI002260ED44|nr:GNAT family N-acetyltransferase [Halovenus salina]
MKIEFRPATADDLELLLAWRSHPEVYHHFSEQDEPLVWENHLEWWQSRENRRDWIIVINTAEQWRDVGSVSVADLETETPEVGVYVGEITSWGNGIATDALNFITDWLREQNYAEARAKIAKDNEASQNLFEKVGFERISSTEESEGEYLIDL